MSAVFNGAAALYCDESVVGSEPDYLVLCILRFKQFDASSGIRMVSLHNRESGTNRRELYGILNSNGSISSVHYDGLGTSSAGPTSATSENQWYIGIFSFEATNLRRVKLNNHSFQSNITNRLNSMGLNRTTFGSLAIGNPPTFIANFNGKLAEIAIWSNIDSSVRDDIITDYLNNVSPNLIFPTYLRLYQSLRNDINIDHIGPDLINENVTFDSNDHPGGITEYDTMFNIDISQFYDIKNIEDVLFVHAEGIDEELWCSIPMRTEWSQCMNINLWSPSYPLYK